MSQVIESQSTAAELERACRSMATRAKAASRKLAVVNGEAKNRWLLDAARANERAEEILAANALDVEAAPGLGLNAAAIDRLTLNLKRIEGIKQALVEVAHLPDPVGEVIESSRRPNGLDVSRVRVPLGVIFMIYESRPNVTADAAALCVKSGNAAILRGGKEAIQTNQALHRVLSEALEPAGLPTDSVQLVGTTDRAAVGHLLKMPELIDLAIPRGGEGLIRRVTDEAEMPVLKHFQGNCHVYVDASADVDPAVRVVVNSKAQRPGSATPPRPSWSTAPLPRGFSPQRPRPSRSTASSFEGTKPAVPSSPRSLPRFPRIGTPSSSTSSWPWRRRLTRRGRRPHRPPRLGSYRGHPHQGPRLRAAVCRRGG